MRMEYYVESGGDKVIQVGRLRGIESLKVREITDIIDKAKCNNCRDFIFLAF